MQFRGFVLLAILVAVASFATAFTNNRLADGIAAAALASTVPTALLLSLRRA
jgi:hypothetical protein